MNDPFQTVFLLTSFIQFTWSWGLAIACVVILFLFCISAATSAAEIAFFSLSPNDIKDFRLKKDPSNQRVLKFLDQPKRLLATILIANNFMNVGIVILSTYITASLFNFSEYLIWGFIIQVVLLTSIILLFCEIMPKIYATKNPKEVVRTMATPLNWMTKAFHPLSSVLTHSTEFIDKRMALKGYKITMDDISDAIDITANGTTDEEDRKLLKSITRFGDITAREIMRPRVEATLLEQTVDFDLVIKIISDSGYSRIPVYDDTPDRVIGILYIKDVFPHFGKDAHFAWQPLVRPAFFVPENKPVNDLLQEFRQKKIHMAIVVDEYGGTSGIVTLEDIIEEIVGEINDEFDSDLDAVDYSKINDNTYIFEGKTLLNDLCKILEIDDETFDEVKGESETLAGLILEISGKIPNVREKIMFHRFTFSIEAADKRRIKRVKIELMPVMNDPKK